MKLHSEKHGLTLVLDVEGELDGEGSAELEERCLYEQQEGAAHFVIGLRGVERVTGPGLRVLLGLARSLPRAGGTLVLCELGGTIQEALQVSGLDRVFDIAPDRLSALRRSKQLQVAAGAKKPATRAASEEKIAYAIELLGAEDPAASAD
jgi:anti-anti-sigma factor